MKLEQQIHDPYEDLKSKDLWVRRLALSKVVKQPIARDRELLEEFLHSEDTTLALLAFLGLKKLYPSPIPVQKVWQEIFGESVSLLTKRACSGPLQLRIAALKALAFAPEYLSMGLIDKVMQSLDGPSDYEYQISEKHDSLPLVQKAQAVFLPEGFSLLLASLPGSTGRLELLQRELYSTEPARLVPVLLSLQVYPIEELTDRLLPLVRASDKRVAKEASRALYSCGGNRVFLMLLSLLKETSDPERKSWLIPLVARTSREEVWPILIKYSKHESPLLRKKALDAISIFPVAIEEKAKIYKKLLSDKEPSVACHAAQLAWNSGSMRALNLLKEWLVSSDKSLRLYSSKALSELNAEIAVPLLTSRLATEQNGNIIRTIILSLRSILPEVGSNPDIYDLLLLKLSRLMKSTDAFKRNQSAVLCGIVGKCSENILLDSLDSEHHSYVIASILSALAKIGTDRLLVFSRFCDHSDARVRANMILAMMNCGVRASAYFMSALKDSSTRVVSAAARALFITGQIDVVHVLNRMLLVPSPRSVLSASYALGQLLRIQPPIMQSDHPIPLALSRAVKNRKHTIEDNSHILSSAELPNLFKELAIAGANRKKMLWILEEKHKRFPASFAIKRLFASICVVDGQFEKALSLIESCLNDHPSILADLLDAYRLALKTGNLDKATKYGEKVKSLYKALLNGCMELCRTIKGSGADLMLERLYNLSEPSMNLYNAMIQIKVLEGDKETVIELLAELMLARPANIFMIRKLTSLLEENREELREALSIYASSFD